MAGEWKSPQINLICSYFASKLIFSGLLAGVVSGGRTFSHSFPPCIWKVKVLTQGQCAQAKSVSELCQTLNEVSLLEKHLKRSHLDEKILWYFHISYFMTTLIIHLIDWLYVLMMWLSETVSWIKINCLQNIKITSSSVGFLVERFQKYQIKVFRKTFPP